MEISPTLFATAEFYGVDRNGAESVLLVGVGRPTQQPTGEWACPTLTYDLKEPRLIYGEDSLQALCLGLSLIRTRLEGWMDSGGRIFVGESREEISRVEISTWFGGLGSQS